MLFGSISKGSVSQSLSVCPDSSESKSHSLRLTPNGDIYNYQSGWGRGYALLRHTAQIIASYFSPHGNCKCHPELGLMLAQLQSLVPTYSLPFGEQQSINSAASIRGRQLTFGSGHCDILNYIY